MNVKVTYATEFGCRDSIMDLKNLTSFVKKFKISNVVPCNLTLLDDELEILKENILENSMADDWGEGRIIDLEVLEEILTKFFNRTITLKL